MNKEDEVKNILTKYNNSDIFKIYNLIEENKKEEFLDEILNIDFDLQEKLYNSTKVSKNSVTNVENVVAIDKATFSDYEFELYNSLGVEEIKTGKFAIVTLAGGQGTRLGHNGPKGTFMLLPNLSLFEILCKNLKKAYSLYGSYINWYIMTSNDNYADTISFFEKNNYFDYPKEYITFFKQKDIPMNSFNGKLIINEKGHIKRGANGHGGVFESMEASGVLSDIKEKGIDWGYVTPVDNPLIELVDPLFLGYAKNKNLEMFGKTIVRKDPNQKSGVFCLADGKINVLEYTEISPGLMSKANEDGSLYLSFAHINCNMFNVNTIDKILKKDIPYHVAKKKCTYMDLDGNIIVPEEPNAYKYEKFIFDYFPYILKSGIYVVDRSKEYEPVKSSSDKARIAFLNKGGLN